VSGDVRSAETQVRADRVSRHRSSEHRRGAVRPRAGAPAPRRCSISDRPAAFHRRPAGPLRGAAPGERERGHGPAVDRPPRRSGAQSAKRSMYQPRRSRTASGVSP